MVMVVVVVTTSDLYSLVKLVAASETGREVRRFSGLEILGRYGRMTTDIGVKDGS